MLITQPILVLTRTAPPANGNPGGFELASASIDASVYLVKSCAEGHHASLLLGNMRVIK
jgi:hypothetical protein